MAPLSVAATCDCTATSANVLGRYFRARARAMEGKLCAGVASGRLPLYCRPPNARARGTPSIDGCSPAPSAPGLTKRRQTPHAAATFGVLTELEGCRPSGPGT